jgi:hypothetical protein
MVLTGPLSSLFALKIRGQLSGRVQELGRRVIKYNVFTQVVVDPNSVVQHVSD